jgi:hypothetical protein
MLFYHTVLYIRENQSNWILYYFIFYQQGRSSNRNVMGYSNALDEVLFIFTDYSLARKTYITTGHYKFGKDWHGRVSLTSP